MNEYSGPNLNLASVAEPTILWFESFSKGTNAVGEQVGRFMGERAKRNVDTWVAMTQSRSLVNLLQVQEHWITGMMNDYGEQGHRVMEIINGVVQEFQSRCEQKQPQHEQGT